jgi:outer membrane protein assembly factor BamB
MLAQLSNADDWLHWRGPEGNGVSTAAKPPIEWDYKQNIKWKVELAGKGSGSPVIWNDRVFVVTAISEGGGQSEQAAPRRGRRPRSRPTSKTQCQLHCYNRANGELIWKKTAVTTVPHEGGHGDNNFASASPCTDGKHVWAHFGSRGVYCYSIDGELKWKYDKFAKMTTRGGFGEGCSPVLAGDKLIVPHDHEGPSKLYAFDKTTGEIKWEIERDEPSNWATPIVVEHKGKKQIVQNGQNYVRAYDAETGAELWRCGGQAQRPVASPVKIDDMVIVTSGHRGSFLGAFRLGGKGDIKGTEKVVWTLNRNTPDIASPIISGDRLYFHKQKRGEISCYNAKTGEPFFETASVPKVRATYASPVAAGGHIYLTGRSGNIAVIKDAEEFELVGVNDIGEPVDATPAPVDNQLFVRGSKHLFCIQAKTEK